MKGIIQLSTNIQLLPNHFQLLKSSFRSRFKWSMPAKKIADILFHMAVAVACVQQMRNYEEIVCSLVSIVLIKCLRLVVTSYMQCTFCNPQKPIKMIHSNGRLLCFTFNNLSFLLYHMTIPSLPSFVYLLHFKNFSSCIMNHLHLTSIHVIQLTHYRTIITNNKSLIS